MCYINKLDRTGANFYYCGQTIIDRRGAVPAPLYLPIGAEGDFIGLVDLVQERGIVWKDESLGAEFEYVDIPDDMKDKTAEYREKLIELAVEQDDAAMEAYLEGELPDVPTLKALSRQAPLAQAFAPWLWRRLFK